MATSMAVPRWVVVDSPRHSYTQDSPRHSYTQERRSTASTTNITMRRRRSNSSWCTIIRCLQEEDSRPSIPFDFSRLRDIPTLDGNSIRRANYNARRRLIQNRGVAPIYPEVYGQATKIEKVWKEWKKVLRDSYSRGLEYLTPEVIDAEDELIIANDGLWIEKKYPDIKTKSTIITKEGEVLH